MWKQFLHFRLIDSKRFPSGQLFSINNSFFMGSVGTYYQFESLYRNIFSPLIHNFLGYSYKRLVMVKKTIESFSRKWVLRLKVMLKLLFHKLLLFILNLQLVLTILKVKWNVIKQILIELSQKRYIYFQLYVIID